MYYAIGASVSSLHRDYRLSDTRRMFERNALPFSMVFVSGSVGLRAYSTATLEL